MSQPEPSSLSEEDILNCINALKILSESPEALARLSPEKWVELMRVTGRISRPDRHEARIRHKATARLKKQKINAHERKVRSETGIRTARKATIFSAPERITLLPLSDNTPTLVKPRNCYVCKAEFTQVHHFYDSMCPSCAAFNYAKRFQTADLKGQVALITGSRLKIGYQASLMMLRAGALVIATTRFPLDSALRYSREKDFPLWKDRLHIYGLDLRHTPSVEMFCRYIEQRYHRLDILINNAAQTVRRPPGFYSHLMAEEIKPFESWPEDIQRLLRPFEDCKRHVIEQSPSDSNALTSIGWNGKVTGMGLRASAQLSQIPYAHDHDLSVETVFPQGKLDADLQQVDLRSTNSWRLKLGDIATAEMIELQLVNAIAPFVLCNKLSSMMKRENTGQKHIVNVSAMEGKFHRYTKTDRHPHTNMAKAALNMLTHTSASDLAKYGIYMNAVDTGWVTDEDPAALSARKQQEHDFQPPLDIVDGAARVCDPFFNGILTGEHWCGKFLKDYFPIDW